jgi:hypothetical protein
MEQLWTLVGLGIAFIASAATMAAFMLSLFSKISNLGLVLVGNTFRVDALWDIYGLDAMKRGVATNLMSHASAIVLHETWHDLFPADLTDRLMESASGGMQPEDIWRQEYPQLSMIVNKNDITAQEVFGVIRAMCDEGIQ